MSIATATVHTGCKVRPLTEEASGLDTKLGRFVHHRLVILDRRTINGEDKGDIVNASWERVLPKPTFHARCVHIRIKYLRTTATNHMSNLLRAEEQRREALVKNWDKILIKGTGVRLGDVWDHIAFLFDWKEESAELGLVSRFDGVEPGQRDNLDPEVLAGRCLLHLWCESHECRNCRWRCCCCLRACYRHRYRYRCGCDHPVCVGRRMFLECYRELGVAEALRRSAEFVLAQVSQEVAPHGDHHERDRCCCCRCGGWCCRR